MPFFTVGEVFTAALANALAMSPTAKSGSYTAVDGDFVIMTGGHVVTLPAPTNQAEVLIYSDDSNIANGFTAAGSAVVKGLGLGTGTAAGTLVPLGTGGAFALAKADGTNWRIIAGNVDSGYLFVGGTGVAFQSPWVNNGENNTRYRLTGNTMRLAGGLTGGGSGTVAFTLPAGMRPLVNCSFPISAGAGGATAAVATSGTVTISGTGPFTIDGITFTVD
jgi:hypothetical protein